MNVAQSYARVHGGTDLHGAPAHDFSTNANSAGPCPDALEAVRQADASRYPEPGYQVLREQLAQLHGVDSARIVVGASASELIFRITAWACREGARTAWVPPHAYGDYRAAAGAWRLQPRTLPQQADLCWCCEPSNPLGQCEPQLEQADLARATWAMDRAYEPLRLGGSPRPKVLLDKVWQLRSPNKSLGLTGVRAAYAIAPQHAEAQARELEELSHSWPLGAHGLALLQAWCTPGVQQWLRESLLRLRAWKQQQIDMCRALGWQVAASDANFFCARPSVDDLGAVIAGLREAGIKLRDCASFGLPGWVRLGVLPPPSQTALASEWSRVTVQQQPSPAPPSPSS